MTSIRNARDRAEAQRTCMEDLHRLLAEVVVEAREGGLPAISPRTRSALYEARQALSQDLDAMELER